MSSTDSIKRLTVFRPRSAVSAVVPVVISILSIPVRGLAQRRFRRAVMMHVEADYYASLDAYRALVENQESPDGSDTETDTDAELETS